MDSYSRDIHRRHNWTRAESAIGPAMRERLAYWTTLLRDVQSVSHLRPTQHLLDEYVPAAIRDVRSLADECSRLLREHETY